MLLMQTNTLSFSIRLCALALLLAPFSASALNSGDKAPECALQTLDGARSLKLSDFKGKAVYLDFWASWCGPCAKSFPFMNKLHQEAGAQGLAVVAINLDENPEDAQAFLRQHPADFTIAGDSGEQCAGLFEVKAMPSTYLIGRDGVVKDVSLGFRDGEAEVLHKKVSALLSEAPSAGAKD